MLPTIFRSTYTIILLFTGIGDRKINQYPLYPWIHEIHQEEAGGTLSLGRKNGCVYQVLKLNKPSVIRCHPWQWPDWGSGLRTEGLSEGVH